ncbi:Membrane-bound transcription factor site-2 protease [Frankliniella fusca]|uniref:Membrane-bound transcription factor site-2 protease n=1 Tax=Frankliniella fusca TaxID=407009 RepID=A0AAE1LMI3_9NEOP|nr:Membrane-bound transcription factor site-2 protease [Frankliniella fusca]
MDTVTILCSIGFIHCVLFFFNTVFKSCCHYPYLLFLKKTGIDVKFLVLQWVTPCLNRPLQKWGIWRPRFLQWWFSLGTIATVLLLPFAIILLARTIINELKQRLSTEPHDPSILDTVVIVPGYNLPLSDFAYYGITLLLCTFFHEIGHAVAAVREDVHIHGTGFSLFFILPAAYVYLDTSQLNALAPSRKLRVLCAGVWHNIVLALYALLVLLVLPFVYQPFYIYGEGVYVTDISPDSSALGPTGLRNYDVITALNECSVSNSASWKKCLLESLRNPTPGYCISAEFVRENDESIADHPGVGGVVECCSKEASALGRLCFQLVDDSGGPVALPELSCLSARELIESGNELCATQSLNSCVSPLHCLRPTIGNYTKLVTIHRSRGQVVLFLGNPAEIYQTVKVSDYIPRWDKCDPLIPQVVETFTKYIYLLSSGLAIANVLPVFFFDGQHISSVLCDLLLAKHVKDSSTRLAISLCLNVLGTLLLLTGVLMPFLLKYV